MTVPTPPAVIGFVGLGNMGYPMAGHLARAGFRVLASDLKQETVERFCQEYDASAATSLQALGAQCDVVITMLPEGGAVRKVLMDAVGVVSGLRQGAILVDMSSSSPVHTRELAAELAAQRIPLLDAPVSGGVAKAREAGIAIMAGGDAVAIEICRPVFEAMGRLFLTGKSGSGHAMKALNNYLSAATLAVTSEALLAGVEFGLDPAVMVDIINASTGRSNSSEHKFPTFVLPRKFTSGFFLGLMAKDLRFAKELAEATGTSHALLDVVSGIYDAAENELGFTADNIEVFRYLEELGGE
ncbi:MAG TPA: NAD(P)-dependent oxidoreductase [Pseudomonadaceae bacterium]|nr:NAD(P)-dependent oxidoreductase [Pseudomonadaceae bacterium]